MFHRDCKVICVRLLARNTELLNTPYKMDSVGKGQPWTNRTLDRKLKFRTLYSSMYIILRVYCVRNLMDQQNKKNV
jgi:hypothetical protein